MKVVLLLTVLSVLLPALPAGAGATGRPWDVLIVDNDPKGTNVRDAPSGTVIATIPVTRDGAPRLVKITGQADGWFSVVVDGRLGWMHGSVLGTCASGTEDGDPDLSRGPRNDSLGGVTVPSGAPVHLLGMHERWLRVRYVDAHGTRHDGWLPEQAVAQSENEQAQCARAWARR